MKNIRRQGGGEGVDEHENSSRVRKRGQREQYSEKVHVPLYQLSDRYCSPEVPLNTDVVTPSRWAEERKVNDDNCLFDCGPKKLVQSIEKTTFNPLFTYKTIAAG